MSTGGLTRSLKLVVLLSVLTAVVGCTHTMQVKNLGAYATTASAPTRLNILLRDRSAGGAEHEYFSFVHQALATHPSVGQVVLEPEVSPEFVPDFVVDVDPHASYKGSGLNYLITFPGFLLFTHAWNGFIYGADLVTSVTVTPRDGTPGQPRNLEMHYDLRHCDFERGAWTSSGWYLPGFGATNLIVGAFMVRYDPDATADFKEKVKTAYGTYIANKIVEMTLGASAHAGEVAG